MTTTQQTPSNRPENERNRRAMHPVAKMAFDTGWQAARAQAESYRALQDWLEQYTEISETRPNGRIVTHTCKRIRLGERECTPTGREVAACWDGDGLLVFERGVPAKLSAFSDEERWEIEDVMERERR